MSSIIIVLFVGVLLLIAISQNSNKRGKGIRSKSGYSSSDSGSVYFGDTGGYDSGSSHDSGSSCDSGSDGGGDCGGGGD